jgi:predicted nuclease with TOPRIM domain
MEQIKKASELKTEKEKLSVEIKKFRLEIESAHDTIKWSKIVISNAEKSVTKFTAEKSLLEMKFSTLEKDLAVAEAYEIANAEKNSLLKELERLREKISEQEEKVLAI